MVPHPVHTFKLRICVKYWQLYNTLEPVYLQDLVLPDEVRRAH